MFQLNFKDTFILFLVLICLAGCAKNSETSHSEPSPCNQPLPTPIPSPTNIKDFTSLGPEMRGGVGSAFIRNKHVYVEVGRSLAVFDVHDPSRPKQLGMLPRGSFPFKIEDQYAYAYWDDALHILDISQPNELVEVDCVEGSNLNFGRSAFYGNYAYQPYATEGLRIYDVSDWSSPIEITTYKPYAPPPSGTSLSYMGPISVAISDHYAYVGEAQPSDEGACCGQLRVLDISNPLEPKSVAVYKMPEHGAAFEIMLDGHYAYINSYTWGNLYTVVLDMSDPRLPTEAAIFPRSRLFGIHKGFAYFYDSEQNDKGITIQNVSDPTFPKLVNTIPLPLVAYYTFLTPRPGLYMEDVTLDDNYAYVAVGESGLHILDVSDPTDVKEASLIQSDNFPQARSLAILDDVAYLAMVDGSFIIQDISDSNALLLVNRLWPEELEARDVAVSNNIAYIATDGQALSVVDISDLRSPTIIDTYPIEIFRASRVVIQDGMLFVLEEGSGLLIFDNSDPLNLIPISSVPLNVTAYDDLTVSNNHVYVATGENGNEIQVIDISEPTNPEKITRISHPELITSIVADEKFLYAVTSWDSITVFDIQEPGNPLFMSTYEANKVILDIELHDGALYLVPQHSVTLDVMEFEAP